MSRPRKTGGTVYARKDSAFWWISYRNREGRTVLESTGTTDREEAERFLRQRLDARDEGTLPAILASKSLTFGDWAEWYLANRSKPPFRAQKTHLMNLNAVELLQPTFAKVRLRDIMPEAIEDYLRRRLSAGRRCHTKDGVHYRGTLKPMTVHQEFRVLRRMLNVAVKHKRLNSNPCNAVEFPVSVSKTTQKPHYMTSSEQERIEMSAPSHLRHAIVIIAEMGLRPYKELMPIKKSQIDLENSLVYIDDSKTPSGVGDMPMTEPARQAFKGQMEETPGSEYLFPTTKAKTSKPYLTTLKDHLGRDAEKGRCSLFSDLPPAPHICDSPQRRRRLRSFRDAHVAAGRRAGLQAIQPSQAQHDARSPCQTGPASE